MESKSKQTLKGIEKLTGQKKLFCQSAWLAVTADAAGKSVCARRKGPSLPCRVTGCVDRGLVQVWGQAVQSAFCPSHGEGWHLQLQPGSRCCSGRLPGVQHLCRGSARQFCAWPAALWQAKVILCVSLHSLLCHDMKVHSPSRLAWVSTVVLAGLFFSRGHETEFSYIPGVWMQWWPYQHQLELFFWTT